MRKPQNEHLMRAEQLLTDISSAIVARDDAVKKANAEIDVVKSRYADGIDREKKKIIAFEKQLDRLVRSSRSEILGDGDRADLPGGSVMLKEERRVKRIKGMLDRLKAAGMQSAIKTAKEYVNWDRVEMFNDGMLERLGTERVSKTIFSYELKG